MCDLCSSDEAIKTAERKRYIAIAELLEEVAYFYRRLAYGEIVPHGTEVKTFAATIRKLIRALVKEWV